MDIDDFFFFETEPQEPYKMSQKEFVEKTKSVLEKIFNAYLQAWGNRSLRDGEYPEESVCDKCTGCGLFIDNDDGEEKECFEGNWDCFTKFCDYEQVGVDLETHIEDIVDLLSVDEVVNTEHDSSGCT